MEFIEDNPFKDIKLLFPATKIVNVRFTFSDFFQTSGLPGRSGSVSREFRSR